jgi:anti-sigma28 factor (negative regulator of flagellin synthesis)
MIWKSVVHIATASARSTNNQKEMSLLDIHYSILKSEPDDVRWEKLDHVRLMLANGTYRISSEQVATNVIDQMLESDNHHWKRSMGRRERSPGSTLGRQCPTTGHFFSFDHSRPSPT